MARQLRDIGERISDITLMVKVLGSLPAKFAAFVTAWDSVDANNQTFENLTQRLIKEEDRMNAMDEASSALAAVTLKHNQEKKKLSENKTKRYKKEIICFYCQKRDHIAKECRKKRKDSNSQNDNEKNKRKNGESDSSAFIIEPHANELTHQKTFGYLIAVLQST